MARVCEICGKGRQVGNQMTIRGKAKYLGGVGTKVTGITRRTYLPNLQDTRITTENGTNKTVRICAQCLRSGAVVKRVRNAPFKMTAEKERKMAAAIPSRSPGATPIAPKKSPKKSK